MRPYFKYEPLHIRKFSIFSKPENLIDLQSDCWGGQSKVRVSEDTQENT